jgi:hypothetical protein
LFKIKKKDKKKVNEKEEKNCDKLMALREWGAKIERVKNSFAKMLVDEPLFHATIQSVPGVRENI